MSLISKALKKVQDSRRAIQENKAKNIVYLSDAPQSWPRTALMGLLIISTIVSVLISIAAIKMTMGSSESKQIQVLNLEKTINNQEKRINDFISAINKNQKFTDSELRDLNARLKEEGQDIKTQMDILASTDNGHYSDLKDAILNDKEDISLLNRETNNLKEKIEKISIEETQTKDPTIPVSGN